jgi:cell division protein FtsB
MRDKLITTSLIVIGFYLIVSSVKDIWFLSQKGQEVEKAQKTLDKAVEEKQRLEKQLQYTESPDFVEKEARNKLGMSKPGETVIILPTNVEQIVGSPEEPKKVEIPNWKKWGILFGIFK